MRISPHIGKDGDYYPSVRQWMHKLGTTELDVLANRILIGEADARAMVERIVPGTRFKVRKMSMWGRANAFRVVLQRQSFQNHDMVVGTVLHEIAHTLTMRANFGTKRVQPHGEVFSRTYANLLRKEVPMIAAVPLTPGITIKYNQTLWRVDMVNVSRALIIPLNKTADADAGTRGVSIGANSYVEQVVDLETELTRMELREAEREIAEGKKALANEAKTRTELAAVEAELAALRKEAGQLPVAAKDAVVHISAQRGTKQAWRLTPKEAPWAAAGSLKALVLAFVRKNPGLDTKTVASNIKGHTGGAVAACLDRFWKAGVLAK